jgi:hypothetical protein
MAAAGFIYFCHLSTGRLLRIIPPQSLSYISSIWLEDEAPKDNDCGAA